MTTMDAIAPLISNYIILQTEIFVITRSLSVKFLKEFTVESVIIPPLCKKGIPVIVHKGRAASLMNSM
jgi:hypothetical protein